MNWLHYIFHLRLVGFHSNKDCWDYSFCFLGLSHAVKGNNTDTLEVNSTKSWSMGRERYLARITYLNVSEEFLLKRSYINLSLQYFFQVLQQQFRLYKYYKK